MHKYRGMPVTAAIISAIQRVAKYEGESSRMNAFCRTEGTSELHLIEFSVRDVRDDHSPHITLGFFETEGEVFVYWSDAPITRITETTVPKMRFALKGTGCPHVMDMSAENYIDLRIFAGEDHLQIFMAISRQLQLAHLQKLKKEIVSNVAAA